MADARPRRPTLIPRRAIAIPLLLVAWGAPASLEATGSSSTGSVHTRLESSVPSAGAVISQPPARFEFRFSGPVNGDLSTIVLEYPSGDSLALSVAGNPGDETLLVADTPDLQAGVHVLHWRTVSRDGHAVAGTLSFTAAGAAVTIGDPAPAAEPPPPDLVGEQSSDVASGDAEASGEPGPAAPLAGVILSALGLACLLGFTGLLWFVGSGPMVHEPRIGIAVRSLGVGALLLAGSELALWLSQVRVPDAALGGLGPGLGSRTGLVGAGRLLLVGVALVSVRRPGRAAEVAALSALVAGAAAGHPAAIAPWLAVPANALHQGAAAIWLGGLLLLILAPARPADGTEAWNFEDVSRAVSAGALLAVGLIVVSGVVQSVLFVGDLPSYAGSRYGRAVLVKTAGFVALIAFGAYHRRRTLPALASGDEGASLRRTVRLETIVMLAVVAVAAYLARLSPPAPH